MIVDTAKILRVCTNSNLRTDVLQLYMKSTTQVDSLNGMFPADREYNVTISEQR